MVKCGKVGVDRGDFWKLLANTRDVQPHISLDFHGLMFSFAFAKPHFLLYGTFLKIPRKAGVFSDTQEVSGRVSWRRRGGCWGKGPGMMLGWPSVFSLFLGSWGVRGDVALLVGLMVYIFCF